MDIHIFGKADCAKCETAKRRFENLLSKWKLNNMVKVCYYDMDTVDGRAEGAFHDVHKIPTIILQKNGATIIRWDGNIPEIDEVRSYLLPSG